MSQTQTTPPSTQPSRPHRAGWTMGILTVLFRLLLLGVSGGLAWLIGVAIAQMLPGTVSQPPLTEQLIQRGEVLDQNRRHWLSRFQSDSAGPGANDASPTPAASPLTLSPTDQQAVKADLVQLQTDLQTLSDRTAQLETQLGIVGTMAPLEERLQQIQQQVDPTAASTGDLSVSSGTETDATADPTLLVTLPTDGVFEADGLTLQPTSRVLLDSIARDLSAYPGQVIRVAAHTDTDADAATQRAQSFEQATAITQYLQTRLGDSATWLTIGYGQTRPLTQEQSPAAQQRNRRIEISIAPR